MKQFLAALLSALVIIGLVAADITPAGADHNENHAKGRRRLSVNDRSIAETNAGTIPMTFTVTLAQASPVSGSVSFATADGTAVAGSDYTPVAGVLTFAAGETSKTVDVPVRGDTLHEADETFFLNLFSPVRLKIQDGQGTGTILNDDAIPAISIGDTSVGEGQTSETTVAAFPVSLNAPSGSTLTVQYSTGAPATATAGSDYTAVSGATLTFLAGQTSATATVSVIGDEDVEGDETFTVTLSSPVNATIADGTATGTIIDNDPVDPVSISVADASADEGENVDFTVTLSGVLASDVEVQYATSGNTATQGVDYPGVSTPQTATITAGQTSTTISIATTEDDFDEPDETFFLNLSNPTNPTILADSQGVGTILDDDATPSISITDVTISEGDAGVSTASFPVTLSNPSGQLVTVAYATAPGTATADLDYATTSGTVSFAPGETSRTIGVVIVGDTLDELDETFFVNLSGATNAVLLDGQALGTIVDDDAAASPLISISDVTVTEGDGVTVVASFDVTLSDFSDSDISFDYATVAGTATENVDYTAASGDNIVIPAGETSKVITVSVTGDTEEEVDETFSVVLSDLAGVTASDTTGLGTIQDNDEPAITRTIEVGDVDVVEGNANTTASFVVELSETSSAPVSVDYSTGNGTAVAPDDYLATSGTVQFAAGEDVATVMVTIVGDIDVEPSEVFYVNLTGPAGDARIADGQAVGTIHDNDPVTAPSLSISDVDVLEGDAGSTNAVFTATLSEAAGSAVTVDWATAPGSAVAPADFAADAGSLTFPTGVTTAFVTVAVAGDLVDEDTETFFVNLSNAAGAAIADPQGLGRIFDNDPAAAVTLSVADSSAIEGDAMTFTVTRDGPTDSAASATWSTALNGSADTDDLTMASATVTVPALATEATFVVATTPDTTDEPNETFLVNLSAPSAGVSLADPQALGTIIDNDGTPQVSVADVASPVTEGASATFVLTLDAPSEQVVSVNYDTADGSALAGSDYTAASGTAQFAANVTSTSVMVATIDDSLDEPAETFTLDLSDPINATIGDGSATATIADNDGAPSISVADIGVTEGGDATFVVTLDAVSSLEVTVDYATADGTAVEPGDYTSASGPATIPAGSTSVNVVVATIDDSLDEAAETFTLELSNPSNATIGDGSATATIADNDAAPSVSVADVTPAVSEGGSATFVVSLDAVSGLEVTVDYATADGTAVAPGDYTSASGPATIPAGSTSVNVVVATIDDSLDEDAEAFTLELSNPSNATIGDGSATATIADNDAAPSISVADITVTEGDSGSKPANFAVTLSKASGKTATVRYRTVDGTATSGDDFSARSGVLTFAPGQTSKTVAVPVMGDEVDEQTETFTVVLSSASNATIARGTGTGTIRDNDVTVAGESGTRVAVGYWTSASDGGIFSFGAAPFYGSTGDIVLNQPIVGMTPTTTGEGYWLVASDGGIFSFGDATFHGSTGDIVLNQPIVGMAATPTGNGYWLVASDGGIFSFGDAIFYGSTGDIVLNQPIVGMAPTPSGIGYWMVASDGGIFSFGDAVFQGSTGDIVLNQPIVGMAPTLSGNGYWLVATDGGIFAFGDAAFFGSTGDIVLNQPIVGMAPTPSGIGYWMVASDGGIFSFGDATFYGSMGGLPLNKPMIGIAPVVKVIT